MRRRLLAAVWIAGATVPLLMATVFLVGCCVLPFHNVVHKLMPLCEMAADVLRGEHEHDAEPQTPAREKQEPVKRITSLVPVTQRLAVHSVAHPVAPSSPQTGYRSFITLGAVRCDRDVGLHVLVDTFRI